MIRKTALLFLFGLYCGLVGLPCQSLMGQGTEARQARQKSITLMRQGNFREALAGFEKLCTSRDTDPKMVSSDLTNAVSCLQRLGEIKKFDSLIEETVKAHSGNWRLLQTAAKQYMSVPHYGFMISGKYERGPHRGGGKMANSQERDRIRALQLMTQAMPMLLEEGDRKQIAAFYLDLSNQLFYYRGYYESWRLQYKSDLTVLPDYEDGFPVSRGPKGASVDENGRPIYYEIASDWENALNDGERWRYCLDQVEINDPSKRNYVRQQIARFARNQFGVTTMQQGMYWPAMVRHSEENSNEENESGIFAIHTLSAKETIAKLANGIKRFELPDEYNFIRIYEDIVERPETGYAEDALTQLAQIHEDRRQYVKAAAYWKQNIEKFGPGANAWKRKRLDQIVKNWGRFEGISEQVAGKPAVLDYRFRNGSEISFTAEQIDVDRLLNDAIEHIKSKADRLDWNRINIVNIGNRLIHADGAKYVEKTVATWNKQVKPRKNHYDDRVSVKTPLSKPGAYVVTARMKDGNVSKIIVWISDTVLVRKPLSEKSLFFVADAKTGKPVGAATIHFFGYKQTYRPKTVNGRRINSVNITTKEFTRKTAENGQLVVDKGDLDQQYQWLIRASTDTKPGRRAFWGFQGIWHSRIYDEVYNQTKSFVVTDRPVYRPKQTVEFKIWTRHAQYDQADTSQFAGRTISYSILNPKGETIVSNKVRANEFGAITGKFSIPSDAMLGQYTIQCRNGAVGGNTFRVEEYKKPEFEVTVEAPTEPVKLGDKVTGKIRAKYFFGAPVSNATVKYTITRQEHTDKWFPAADWDWCYGPGYWWFCYDTPWFPGFRGWCGCFRPWPWWYQNYPDPPEVVAEQEVKINPDGTVDFEIDTLLAKELHGDQNHRYNVTAEVRDTSRRTIVGSGEVLVAQKPFKIFSWLDRGYYRSGDVVKVNFKAQTLDKQPVKGDGVLKLFKVSYNKNAEPVETEVASWELDTNAEGEATQQARPNQPGQYRFSYKVTDTQGNSIEGGYVFTVIGQKFASENYRFNDLELIPEKREYRAGENVKLQLNTNRRNGYVLLFLRPANGVYLPPKMIELDGKSTVIDIPVSRKDMPNFYVEALTVTDGKVVNETKEIVVPPEQRMLNVSVTPSSEFYRPGQKAKVKVHVTDHTGENFVGDLAISIYDKSVEYISGGSNTPDIREFFWKWRRRHNPNQFHSLQKYSGNLVLRGQMGMNNLGAFGEGVVEDLEELDDGRADVMQKNKGMAMRQNRRFRSGGLGGFGGGGGGFGGAPAPATAEANFAADSLGAPGGGFAMAKKADGAKSGGAAVPDLVQPKVRSNFADTALWVANLTTDSNGMAEVELEMPENLTTWKINVYGVGHGTRVGSGSAEVITRKDLLVRLQAPRFFVQKDEVVLSAIVNNYLPSAKNVRVSLELDGPQIRALDTMTTTVNIKPNDEARVDWRCQVMEPGDIKVRMLALSDEESDAMEMTFPVKVHGFLKMESFAGTVRPGTPSSLVNLVVPSERQPDKTRLEVRYSPTLAMAMIDALPYLNDYPHGCTEQTLNRWLPTLMTQKMLIEMGIDLEDVARKKTNLNAQEIGDDRARADQWRRKHLDPVWSKEQVDLMVQEGIDRLAAMQVSDGGWGWFSGWGERSYPHTTAVVVHGLQVARNNDLSIKGSMLQRGINWLDQYQKTQVQRIKNFEKKVRPWKSSADNLDALVYMILTEEDFDNPEMREFLYRDRNNLSVYAKAVFGIGLHKVGDKEKLAMILRNIDQYVVQDSENETAYIKNPQQGYWYYWYGSEIEANAYYLKLLSRTDPKGKTAPRLVKYLLNNRKHATYWNSTRDTALCVEAFAEYITATGENRPDMTVEILIDGKLQKEVQITPDNLFTFDNKFVMTGSDVTDGKHQVEIRRKGDGPVYWNAYLTNFSTEDYITRAGLEVKIDRKFYKLTPVDKKIKVSGSRGQAVDQKVEKFKRTELKDLATVASGDLIEVELTVVSKNDYEYLLFEDFKPSGFEAVDVRSGYTRNGLRAYTEFRDDRVNFYVPNLARGNHSVSYRLRAETPGRFSALPARIEAMYAPELKGNSDEIKLKVVDKD